MLKVENLDKTFHTGAGDVHAVQNVSFEAKDGELVAILGASGTVSYTHLSEIRSSSTRVTSPAGWPPRER